MSTVLLTLFCCLSVAAPKGKLPAAPAPASWPRAVVADRVAVPVPPGFDKDLKTLRGGAAMLTLTDGTDSVAVTVYPDGAPDAVRIHREELEHRLGPGDGPPVSTGKRDFLGKRRGTQVSSASFRGVAVVAEIVAADLGAMTVVATTLRVADGPNAEVLERIVSGIAVAPSKRTSH